VLRTIAVCAVLVPLGCRRESERTVDRDLIQLFRYTASGQDTTEVDFGSAQADPYLGAGWSAPERGPAGESVARAVERKATVKLSFAVPGERILSVRCGAMQMPSKRPAAVIVRLNGRRIGTFAVRPEMTEFRIALPAAVQRAGENEVDFCARLGHGDERLDVAYDSLDILTASGERRAAPRLDGAKTLSLPASSSVSYFLRLPERPALQFTVADDAGHGRVRVRVEAEGEAPQTVFSGALISAPIELQLSGFASKMVRLVFANDGTTAVRVMAPRLRGIEHVRDGGRPAALQRAGDNVILYVIDTLRADHLGCYGYARATSPQIDALAREGAVFTHAMAQASWTRPATASILTGRYPPAHGATTLRDGLRPDVVTLAELLHREGYRTAAFVTNVNVAPQWGFQRGFDLYRYLPEDEHSPTVHVGSDVVTAEALDWLTTNGVHPFFLYLHATDPHSPYRPPAPWAARLADPAVTAAPERIDGLLGAFRQQGIQPTADEVRGLMARYDGEIAFTDDNFGRLVAELRRRGLYDRTLIVLVADHGEEFLDHGGFEHGRTLYGEMLRVPLIIRVPDTRAPGVRVAATVQQIDVLPTVLDYLALPLPDDLPGRSLLTATSGGAIDSLDVFAGTTLGRQNMEAVITGDWKVIRTKTSGTDRVEAYDLAADAAERADHSAQRPVLLGYAREALAAWAGDATPQRAAAAAPAPDPALMERLRALGYSD
jgi:arylsulfatase A-like enzyme